MLTVNQTAITTQANATVSSAAYLAEQWFNVSIMGIFTDSGAAGTLAIQASNDPPVNALIPNFTPTNWLTISEESVSAGASTFVAPTSNICYTWIRATWTKSAGAGNVTVNIAAQGY